MTAFLNAGGRSGSPNNMNTSWLSFRQSKRCSSGTTQYKYSSEQSTQTEWECAKMTQNRGKTSSELNCKVVVRLMHVLWFQEEIRAAEKQSQLQMAHRESEICKWS